MDVASAPPPNASSAINPNALRIQTPKSPEPESETPTRIQFSKPFSNGAVSRHHAIVVTYKECLKNHAAAIGGHALDGCGEFMPSPSSTPSDPTSLKCAACGCHRNFHRRDPDDHPATALIEYQPNNRHQAPPPPSSTHRSPDSASPPPISSSYMLLALSAKRSASGALVSGGVEEFQRSRSSNKRFRTKFSQYQKERMHEMAERLGWKMQKAEEAAVRAFCSEIGVEKGVFKVWMHNNKNTFGKKDQLSSGGGGAGGARKVPASDPEQGEEDRYDSRRSKVVGEVDGNGGNGNRLFGYGFESDSAAHGGGHGGASSSSS